jgi:hypothetical protein
LKLSTGPFALGATVHSTDHNIRAQAAAVEAQVLDGSVGGDQERQYVEALWSRVLYQRSAGPGRISDELERFGRVPIVTGNFRFTVAIQCCFDTEQFVIFAGSNDSGLGVTRTVRSPSMPSGPIVVLLRRSPAMDFTVSAISPLRTYDFDSPPCRGGGG